MNLSLSIWVKNGGKISRTTAIFFFFLRQREFLSSIRDAFRMPACNYWKCGLAHLFFFLRKKKIIQGHLVSFSFFFFTLEMPGMKMAGCSWSWWPSVSFCLWPCCLKLVRTGPRTPHFHFPRLGNVVFSIPSLFLAGAAGFLGYTSSLAFLFVLYFVVVVSENLLRICSRFLLFLSSWRARAPSSRLWWRSGPFPARCLTMWPRCLKPSRWLQQ